MKVKF